MLGTASSFLPVGQEAIAAAGDTPFFLQTQDFRPAHHMISSSTLKQDWVLLFSNFPLYVVPAAGGQVL